MGAAGHSLVCVLKLLHCSFVRAIAMAMDPTQHMLNKSEFDTLATLLARAHISGDTAILEKHVEKAYQELIAGEHLEKLVEYSGGMSEAAKRRIQSEVEDEFELLDELDPIEAALEERNLQSLVNEAVGKKDEPQRGSRFPIGHVAADVQPHPGSRGGLNHRVVVPEGITDDAWDETVCDLPAVKSMNKTCAEIREEARAGNLKLRTYLNFVMAKFGEAGVMQIITTGNTKTQGYDLGAWLLRNCWDTVELPPVTTFTRRLRSEIPAPDGATYAAKSKAMPKRKGYGRNN